MIAPNRQPIRSARSGCLTERTLPRCAGNRSGALYPAHVPGVLFVVATPIGNLEDITLRALRVLREADLIAAENNAVAAKLLRHYEITTPTTHYNDRNRERTGPDLLARLAAGQQIALISDAGTPGVSDPGRALVAEAAQVGARVVPIPGPAAPIALWSVSGTPGVDLRLRGFLPRRSAARKQALLEIAELGLPTTVFESPRRAAACLRELAELLPEARLVIGRELTKLHEQLWRGSPAEAVAAFPRPRGEFTILIIPPERKPELWSDDDVRQALSEAAAAGSARVDASRAVAARSGRPRREVYALWPL